jgi:hypothetical protein
MEKPLGGRSSFFNRWQGHAYESVREARHRYGLARECRRDRLQVTLGVFIAGGRMPLP